MHRIEGWSITNETPLYVVSNNSIPALLLEVGFITDTNDFNYMVNNGDDLAQAIANGIMNRLKQKKSAKR